MDLPCEDQYELWSVLGEYLRQGAGGAAATESPAERQLRERREALEQLRQAAEHLGLDTSQGQAPTTAQYTQTQRALGLTLSARQIEMEFPRFGGHCDLPVFGGVGFLEFLAGRDSICPVDTRLRFAGRS